VFFDHELADNARRRKQAGQSGVKNALFAAPWLGVLEDGAWLRHAGYANAMAQRLARALTATSASGCSRPSKARRTRMPRHAIEALHAKGWRPTRSSRNGVRLMCSDTPAVAVDGLVDLRAVLELCQPTARRTATRALKRRRLRPYGPNSRSRPRTPRPVFAGAVRFSRDGDQ
jgi:threonine aldolase